MYIYVAMAIVNKDLNCISLPPTVYLNLTISFKVQESGNDIVKQSLILPSLHEEPF